MAGAGMFGNLYPYDVIDHDAVHHISAPNISTDPAYGEYFSKFIGCKSCHGAQLNGGISPDPVSPPAPNITGGGNLGKWTVTQFVETMRNGKTPEGKVLKAEFMPWPGIAAHSEVELEGLYNYLKSLPALPTDPGVQKRWTNWHPPHKNKQSVFRSVVFFSFLKFKQICVVRLSSS